MILSEGFGRIAQEKTRARPPPDPRKKALLDQITSNLALAAALGAQTKILVDPANNTTEKKDAAVAGAANLQAVAVSAQQHQVGVAEARRVLEAKKAFLASPS